MRLIAPEGYLTLKKAAVYYLLRNCDVRHRVLLVQFVDGNAAARRAELAILSRSDFEAGLAPAKPGAAPAIQRVKCEARGDNSPWDCELPPWLEDYRDISAESDPLSARANKISRTDSGALQGTTSENEIDNRLIQIGRALEQIDDIFMADDPDSNLNKFARACEPAVNERRFRLFFYLYVAFYFNKWALLSPRRKNGMWDRTGDKYKHSLWGRRSKKKGARHGHRRTGDMEKRVENGYRRYMPKCNTEKQAFAMMLRLDFGCTVELRGDEPQVVHPDGLPFPSYDQFRAIIEKRLTAEERRIVQYGEVRVRNRERAAQGSYKDELKNLGERVYFDSAHVSELPKSYLSNKPLPAMQEVTFVCGSTGYTLGLGASLGGESVSAYKMACFCSAIPKTEFGRLIGVDIAEEDWPGAGLPLGFRVDKGKGAAAGFIKSIEGWKIAHGMNPTAQPQSNSPSESKHPRTKNRQGVPQYKISNLTVLQLLQRQVEGVIRLNKNSDASARASEQAIISIGEDGKLTPLRLRNYLYETYRSDLIQISFDEAVRAFLEPIEFTAENGFLFYKHRRYTSDALFNSGLASALKRSRYLKLGGFMLPIAGRFAWVEFKGRLVEVEVKLDGPPASAYASKQEIDSTGEIASRQSGNRQSQDVASIMQAQERFKQNSGKEWHSGTNRTGRAKNKTKDARDEIKRIQNRGGAH